MTLLFLRNFESKAQEIVNKLSNIRLGILFFTSLFVYFVKSFKKTSRNTQTPPRSENLFGFLLYRLVTILWIIEEVMVEKKQIV